MLTASLFDTEADKEVWRDTATTGFWGRTENQTRVDISHGILIEDLIKREFNPLLATFEKRDKPSPKDLHHVLDPTWPVESLEVRNLRRGGCHGVLSLELGSGLISYESPDNKCEKYGFSAPIDQVKSLGFNRFKVFCVSVSGKGTYYFDTTDKVGLNYVLAAWRSQ
jgi:hypothetical protein